MEKLIILVCLLIAILGFSCKPSADMTYMNNAKYTFRAIMNSGSVPNIYYADNYTISDGQIRLTEYVRLSDGGQWLLYKGKPILLPVQSFIIIER